MFERVVLRVNNRTIYANMSNEFPDEDELDNFGDEEMEVWREMEGTFH